MHGAHQDIRKDDMLKPRFTISNRMTAGLTQIERARGFLEAAKLSEDWLEYFVNGLATQMNEVTDRGKRVISRRYHNKSDPRIPFEV